MPPTLGTKIIATGVDFETIKEAGMFTNQQWPEISQGTTFVARGFAKPGEYAVSLYCVKFRVVELTFE